MSYLGDYSEDDTVYFMWSSNDGDGASITRSTNGTVSVYKDNGTTQSVAGITGAEDFDSLTGIHTCTIDLSADAFYATGADYAVVLSAATVDTQAVNAVLHHFSIENRHTASGSTPPTVGQIADAVLDDVLTDLTDNSLNSGQSITLRKAARALFNRFFREVTQTATTQTVKNDAGATVAAMAVSDDGTTQTKGIAT